MLKGGTGEGILMRKRLCVYYVFQEALHLVGNSL